MLGNLRVGRMGFGMEPERIPCSLINRVGTALLLAEVLMCDLENVAYDQTAGSNGQLGNGITPLASGTGGAAAIGLNWPMAVVVSGQGSAAGTAVNCLAQGITPVACINTAATAAIRGTLMNYPNGGAGRNPEITNAALAANSRPVGYALTAHTVAVGVETITGFFTGLQSR